MTSRPSPLEERGDKGGVLRFPCCTMPLKALSTSDLRPVKGMSVVRGASRTVGLTAEFD